MEHKLILGGEQYLPFARSRIKALRAAGLNFGSQQFEIDGASIKVRVDGQHDYIKIEAAPAGNLFFVFRERAANWNPDNEVFDYFVYLSQAPALGKFKLVKKLRHSIATVTFLFNNVETTKSRDSITHTFLLGFNKKPLSVKNHTVFVAGGDESTYLTSPTLQNDSATTVLLGAEILAEASNVTQDGRSWSVGASGSGGMLTGVVTQTIHGTTSERGFWNVLQGRSLDRTVVTTYPELENGVFPPRQRVTTTTADFQAVLDVDTKDKVPESRKFDESLFPTSTANVNVLPADTIERGTVDFLTYRNVNFRGIAVRGCCKDGFYYGALQSGVITQLYYTPYKSGWDLFFVPAFETEGLLPDGIQIMTTSTLGNICYFDDFVVVKIMDTGTSGIVSRRAVLYASFNRVTGKRIAAVAYSEVPFTDSFYAVLNSEATLYKPMKLPGFAVGGGGFMAPNMFRDELACM